MNENWCMMKDEKQQDGQQKFPLWMALVMAAISGWSLLVGNETIFPTTLVFSLLFLVIWIDRSGGMAGIGTSPVLLGDAGRYTLVTFACLIALSSLVVSIWLPGFAEANGMTGLYDGDFVRVTINDFHEFSYMTSFLLLMGAAFLLYFRRRHPSGTRDNACL